MTATENRITLSPEESRDFIARMNDPDADAEARRDASTAGVRVTRTATGFTVETTD